MKKLLSVFVDGLKYDSLQYMPFTSSFNHVPLRSVLGFSITCHPSMYTGLYPNQHKIGFHWVRSEKKNGPYKPLSYFPNIFPFSTPYMQAFISHFYAKLLLKRKASPFMGYGKILNLPMKHCNKLDINEFKYWDEDNYISDEFKTIFELVRQNQLKYHVSNMHKPDLGKIDAIKIVEPPKYDWVYYFIGELDHISHFYGQASNEGIELLKKIDSFIEQQYKSFVFTYGEEGFNFIFWSDHGHIEIQNTYNLYEEFNKCRVNLKDIFHIIDSTTIRFWPETENQKQQIIEVMDKIPEANLVTKDQFKTLHLPNDENIYGKLFYYLAGGTIFTHTIHGFGLKTKSMHGYHPDALGNEGVFASNRKIASSQAALPDVFASKIKSLGIKYDGNGELDGKNILS